MSHFKDEMKGGESITYDYPSWMEKHSSDHVKAKHRRK